MQISHGNCNFKNILNNKKKKKKLWNTIFKPQETFKNAETWHIQCSGLQNHVGMCRTRSVNDTCILSDNRILHGQVWVHYQKYNTYHLLPRSLGPACPGNLFWCFFSFDGKTLVYGHALSSKLPNTFSSISVSLSLKYYYEGYFCKKTWN